MALSKNAMIAIAAVAIIAVAGICAAFMLNNGNNNDKKDDPTDYPNGSLTITTFTDYNGNKTDIKFTEIPDRVVCGCNTALNLLLYLGLGDKIVGCYYNEEPIWEGVQSEYDKLVKRIGAVDASGAKNISGNIQKDVLLSWQPDLVIGWVAWEDAKLGSESFWNDNGCNVMSFNAMTSADYRTVEMMKTDYDNVGKIFNVSDKTTKLYNDTVNVINDVKKKLDGKETIYYALVDGAVNTEKGTVWCYKNSNFIASVLNSIGLTNAFPDGGTVPLATVYEAIGTTDIDLIFYITYGGVTYQKSLESWQKDTDLSKCAAIKNGDVYDMKLSCSYGSTPQLLDAMEKVYDSVDKILERKATVDNYPFSIETFIDYNGNTATITFDKIPERVVCGCCTALNLLLYLGMGDRIVGCYYNEEPIWEGVQDEYDELVKRIGAVDAPGSKNISGNIQKDVLLSWQPDLVIGWVAWEDAKLGTEAFWNENGCNVMSLNAMTSADYRTVEMMKTDYDNVGKIFNVSDKTTKLYNDTVNVINDVKKKLDGKETIYYALVDGAVNTEKGTVWCYKNSNFIASVLNSIGLTNAFPDGGTVPLATVYEAIGTTDIDLIFYITYGGVTYENSLKSWQDDADLSKCAAIKNGDAYDMKLSCSYGSTPQLLDAMEKVYECVVKILDRQSAA